MKKILLVLSCALSISLVTNAYADDLDWLINSSHKAEHLSDQGRELFRKIERNRLKANQGDAEAQYQIAQIYQKMASTFEDKKRSIMGIQRHQFNAVENIRKSVEWYSKSAKQGNAKAQVELGFIFLEGAPGINKDENKAKILFEQAAKQGNARGLLFLGGCYEHGNGVAPDIQKAIKLYKDSAARGEYAGYFRLYLVYISSNQPYQDLQKADEYKRKFCVLAKQNHDPFLSGC